jgi:CRISPR/Cas system CSM-associated protein Csm2 small subunit
VEVVSQWAKDVARALVGRDPRRPLIAKGQLRNFYAKAQSFKRRLDSGEPFDALRAGVQSLERDTAAAVGRQNAPGVFKVFMDKNLPLATRDARNFREGFVEHFQSVVGFFTYLERT